MAHGVGVRDGVRCALAVVGVVHPWAGRREGGGEVVEGLCKCDARVPDGDGDGDEFHPLPGIFLGP